MSARSYLYVPGDKPEMLAKASGRGADALIVDLEDAVAPDRKDLARATVVDWLRARTDAAPPAWVRVNGDALLEDDVRAIVGAGAAGIVVPKVSSPDDIARTRAVSGALPLCALIETADGMLDARAIARAPGVVRLAIGEADLGAELGMTPGTDAWVSMRAHIVLVSAAAGIEQPVGPVATDLRDDVSLRGTTVLLRDMGFGARAAIHPAQVAIINEMFTPTDDEVARAHAVLGAASEHGGGAFRSGEHMVDEAVLRSARRTLARAGIDPDRVEGQA